MRPHDGNCAPCSGFRLRHFLLHLGLQLLRARGIGFVASESDAELIAGSTSGKELPPIHLAILPYIVIIVLKLVLANSMSASDGINTAMGAGAIVLIITNYKYLKGHIVQDLVTGFTSSINPLLLTAALMGFASVVNACAGFQYFMNFAMMLADKMNPTSPPSS